MRQIQYIKERYKALMKKANTTVYSVVLPFYLGVAAKNEALTPDALINNAVGDVLDIFRKVAVGVATIYGSFGAIKYMSSNPNKSMEGTEQIKKAALGLVGVFVMGTIMTYLKQKAESWQ